MRHNKRTRKIFTKARKDSGMSQKDLAIGLGWSSAQFVSNIERGICDISPNLAARLADHFEISRAKVRRAMIEDYREFLRTKV